jgi:hypothetical protein
MNAIRGDMNATHKRGTSDERVMNAHLKREESHERAMNAWLKHRENNTSACLPIRVSIHNKDDRTAISEQVGSVSAHLRVDPQERRSNCWWPCHGQAGGPGAFNERLAKMGQLGLCERARERERERER